MLITPVLNPRILFGIIALFASQTRIKAEKISQILQNTPNRKSLGAFCSLPNSLLTHNTNNVFSDLLSSAHHSFIYNSLNSPPHYATRSLIDYSLQKINAAQQVPIQQVNVKQDLILTTGERIETFHSYPFCHLSRAN